MRATLSPRTWRLAFGGALLLVAWVSLRPLPPLKLPARSDLLAHLIVHGGLGALAMGSYPTRRARGLALAAVLVFGAALELLQGLVPGRHPAASDLLANAIGVTLAAAGWRLAGTRRD